MNLDRLYDVAENENIKIYDYYIENAYGCFINIDKINAIALNYNQFENTMEEKQTLAEELGHYYYDAYYPIECQDKVLINKQEYKAKKYSFNVLVPFEDLKQAIKNGKTSILSLADFFDVTTRFMCECIRFYINKYGYFTNEELIYC